MGGASSIGEGGSVGELGRNKKGIGLVKGVLPLGIIGHIYYYQIY